MRRQTLMLLLPTTITISLFCTFSHLLLFSLPPPYQRHSFIQRRRAAILTWASLILSLKHTRARFCFSKAYSLLRVGRFCYFYTAPRLLVDNIDFLLLFLLLVLPRNPYCEPVPPTTTTLHRWKQQAIEFPEISWFPMKLSSIPRIPSKDVTVSE